MKIVYVAQRLLIPDFIACGDDGLLERVFIQG